MEKPITSFDNLDRLAFTFSVLVVSFHMWQRDMRQVPLRTGRGNCGAFKQDGESKQKEKTNKDDGGILIVERQRSRGNKRLAGVSTKDTRQNN